MTWNRLSGPELHFPGSSVVPLGQALKQLKHNDPLGDIKRKPLFGTIAFGRRLDPARPGGKEIEMVQSRFTAIGIGYPNPWSSFLGELALKIFDVLASRRDKAIRRGDLARLGDQTLEGVRLSGTNTSPKRR